MPATLSTKSVPSTRFGNPTGMADRETYDLQVKAGEDPFATPPPPLPRAVDRPGQRRGKLPAVPPLVGARRMTVILHGKRAEDPAVRAAVDSLRETGVPIDVKVTWECGDAERIVAELVRNNSCDTVIAAGGDGTLNEVVWALLQAGAPRELAVGILPLGTSNDFAAVTHIPQDLTEALLLCADSRRLRAVDVGMINGDVFMNTSTLGASSELGSETSNEAKQMLGPVAYGMKGFAKLAEYDNVPVTLRYPAEGQDPRAPRGTQAVVEVREALLALTAGNSRQVASMLQPCPDAMLDDGLLDVSYFVGSTPASKAAELVQEVMQKGLAAAEPEGLHMVRVPWIEVESQQPLPANRDGEPVKASNRYLLEVLHRRILMHLPTDHLLCGEVEDHDVLNIKTDTRRPGVMGDMYNQVTRFRRATPGLTSWLRDNAWSLAQAGAILALGYGMGYWMGRHNYQEDETTYRYVEVTSKDGTFNTSSF